MCGQLEVQTFRSYGQNAICLGGPSADFDAVDGLDEEVYGLDIGPASEEPVSNLAIYFLDDACLLS